MTDIFFGFDFSRIFLNDMLTFDFSIGRLGAAEGLDSLDGLESLDSPDSLDELESLDSLGTTRSAAATCGAAFWG